MIKYSTNVPKHSLLLIVFMIYLTGCTALPVRQDHAITVAPTNATNTYLGRKFSKKILQHPNRSGFILLSSGLDAFAARASMIKLAEKTIDVQYYFIRYDFAGSVFMGLLLEAANRGVRVRILLDDHYLADKDQKLLAISGHKNVEIRAFNPFRRGTPRFLQYISNFGDISRRMHNKSFTVDNQIAIVGGRNIGTEYFAANDSVEFGDLDVMSIGPIVAEISNSFDSYWNHPLAYTHEVLLKSKPTDELVRSQTNKLTASLLKDSEYAKSLESSRLLESIKSDSLTFEWAKADLLVDSPEKLMVSRDRSDLHMQTELSDLFAKAKSEVIIYSPYFIPGKEGARGLARLVDNGVKVKIFTNSAISNNVGMVHAHYSKYRKSLLNAGVELYEVRQTEINNSADSSDESIDNSSDAKVRKLGLSTVHAKTFVLDRRTIFIGSFNFDARSAVENTEIGVVIESDSIGTQFGDWFDQNIDNISYRLELKGDSVIWIDNSSAPPVISTREPSTSGWTRAKLKMLGWLPVGRFL